MAYPQLDSVSHQFLQSNESVAFSQPSDVATEITRAWIAHQRQAHLASTNTGTEASTHNHAGSTNHEQCMSFAGFLFGLGLHGHLQALINTDVFKLLQMRDQVQCFPFPHLFFHFSSLGHNNGGLVGSRSWSHFEHGYCHHKTSLCTHSCAAPCQHRSRDSSACAMHCCPWSWIGVSSLMSSTYDRVVAI